MYTGTRLTTAIHRRLLSRFLLREGGRLYTGYVLQVVCGFVTKHLSGPSGQFFCPLALFLSLDRLGKIKLTFLTES